MNLDVVMGAWRSHDLSPLFGVDQTLLHQVLRQEQARAEKQLRRMRWFMNVVTVVLLITAALFLAIMIDPKDDDVLVVWDYVVGIVGVVAAIVLAGALFALRRSRRVRDQGFDDSFRDHLRRHTKLNPLSNLTTTFAVRIPRGCHRCECLGRSRPDSLSPICARTYAPSIRSPLALRRCPRENSGRLAVQETSAAPRCGGGDAVDPTTSRAAPAAAARRRSSGA